MPPRRSREAIVAAVAGELLHNGQASRLYQCLVKEKQKAISVDGGVNWPLGNPFEYNGPTLMTSFIVAQPKASEKDLLAAYDAVISGLKARGPNEAELERIRAKMRSDWYGPLEIPISKASVLSRAVLFDGNADSVSRIPSEIAEVTSNEVRALAAKYLINTNRTILYRVPASPRPNAAGAEK
jgi:zinc protease